MKIIDLLEEKSVGKRLVVIYGGRFQPFHRGHYKAYRWLCKKFGEPNIWIATSNKTNFDSTKGKISPFDFNEKKELMVSLYDIKPRKIIKCENPTFSPKEIFKLYKGFLPVYVAAVGDKNEDRYKKGNFFKKLPDDINLPGQLHELFHIKEKTGYYVITPTILHDLSGTKVRKELIDAKGSTREQLFKKFFGKYDGTADSLITARLKDVT